MPHTIHACAGGVLTAGCTGLSADELPERVYVAAGPEFPLDPCRALVVHLAVEQQSELPGQARMTVQPPARGRATQRVPVWRLIVTYSEPCAQPFVQDRKLPDADVIDAAACEYYRRALAIYDACRAAALNDELFTPGLLGLCLPDDDPGGCAGVKVGDITFYGPRGDIAWCQFPVEFVMTEPPVPPVS